MDCSQIATLAIMNTLLIFTFLGTTIVLHLKTDNKIETIRYEIRDFNNKLKEIESRRIKK